MRKAEQRMKKVNDARGFTIFFPVLHSRFFILQSSFNGTRRAENVAASGLPLNNVPKQTDRRYQCSKRRCRVTFVEKKGRLGDGPCMLGWGQQLRKTNLFHSASITFKNLPPFSYQPNSLKRHHVRTTRNDNQFRLHVCNDAIT